MSYRNDIPLRSLADSCMRLARVSGGRVIDDDPRFLMACSPDSMFYSRYVLLEEAKKTFPEILDIIVRKTADGDPAMLSFNCSMPEGDYEAMLAERGFVKMVDQTGMVLSGISMAQAQTDAPDFTIKRVTESELIAWCACIQEGFGPFKAREDAAFQKLLTDPEIVYYAAFVDGKMAGGSMLILDPQYAGIHEVATLEAYRGRGICTALVRQMCMDLEANGISEVSLQASPFGLPVYSNAGFEVVDTVSTWFMPR